MQEVSVQDVVKEYMAAFEARDLDRCLSFFNDDATLEFVTATYHGKTQLAEWHNTRFSADVKITNLDDIKVDGEVVTINGVITSKRLKAWRINHLSGKAIFRVRNGKISELKFGLRNYNPIEAFRT
jgi:uncharacterized protein (TIGR02246 family)